MKDSVAVHSRHSRSINATAIGAVVRSVGLKASKAMLSSLQREPHWLEVAQNTH